MGINWLSMAALSRRVTGLPWSRFVRAQVPGVLLALLLGGIAFIVTKAARSGELGDIAVLVIAAATTLAVAYAVSRLRPEVFLGTHGAWASKQAEHFLRQGLRGVRYRQPPVGESLAKANRK
jgi:hypothetical protein